MAQPLVSVPTEDFLQKTLGAQLLTATTASATLSDTTGLQALPGVFVVDRVDNNGNPTSSKREVVSYVSTSGSTVVTLVRGLAGSSPSDHAVGAVVEFVPDIIWAQAMYDAISQVVVPATGLLDTTKILAPTVIDTDGTLAANSDTKVASQKATKTYVTASIAAIPSASADGWTQSADTWVYASASTFTIAGVDRTLVYQKGTLIKWMEGSTQKYGTVVSSSFSTNTTVTIAVTTDYVIANVTITSPAYSYQGNPQGFPSTFTWAVVYTGFSANPTGATARFRITGAQCMVTHTGSSAGTSNATTMTITSLPIPASQATSTAFFGTDQSAGNAFGEAQTASSSSTITFFQNASGAGWASSGSKNVRELTMVYPI